MSVPSTRPTRVNRRLAGLTVAVVALAGPATAGAHGGYPVVEGRDGGYAVLVQAAPTTQDGRPAVDLTTYATRQDLGEPDLAARVTLEITDGDRTRTLTPRVVGDGYEAVVPGAADAWRGWTIEATVDGAAGRSVVRADPSADYGGTPVPLLAGLGAAVLAVAAGSVLVLRRRLRAVPS